MLRKTPNKVYDPFHKVELGYKNPERLKKAIAAQPKMYDGEKLHSTKLVIDSPDSEETLEDAKESRLKMRNKMVQINYGKLKALYETFVPQQDFSMEQTYFSIPSTSTNGSESKAVTSDLPIPKMPKESKLLKMFDTLEFYKTDVILMSASLSKNLTELKEELIEEVQEMLNIFESMEQKVDGKSSKENFIQNEIPRLLEVSLTSEIRDCVLLSVEKQKMNSTRTQHQKEVDELIEHVNQNTYAYADVHAQNQDLLMTISELKDKLRTIKKGKHVNTKFEKSETIGKLVCVTPFNKNLRNKAKNVSNTKVKAYTSKPVTSHPTPKSEQSQKQSANVIARGMYQITKSETQTPDSKTNIHASNSTGVESSNSVRRLKSKGPKSKNRVLKNT
ncbi:hypothetical protein Tco_0610986 [Tanacetum coccineum]